MAQATLRRNVVGMNLAQREVEVWASDAEDLQQACEQEADALYSLYGGMGHPIRVSGTLTLPARGGEDYGWTKITVEENRK